MPNLMDMFDASRTVTPGPESELCDLVLRHRLPTDKRLERMVFREPRMPTGFPDVVAVYPRKVSGGYDEARQVLTVDHLRVLHYLYCCRGHSVDGLAEDLGRTSGATLRLIDELTNANLLLRRANHVRLRSLGSVFVAKRIVAIEFKISDWRKAIEQAVANTWFASQSYILIRPHRSIENIRSEASRLGVGVFVFDGNEVRTEMDAIEREIPISYGSWLINEWTLRRLKEGIWDDRTL